MSRQNQIRKLTAYAAVFLTVILSVYFFGSGFRRAENVSILDYEVQENGSVMTIHVGVGSSVGYVRSLTAVQQPDGEVRLSFLSAFGGINGSIGAKDTFEIPLDENSRCISVYREGN